MLSHAVLLKRDYISQTPVCNGPRVDLCSLFYPPGPPPWSRRLRDSVILGHFVVPDLVQHLYGLPTVTPSWHGSVPWVLDFNRGPSSAAVARAVHKRPRHPPWKDRTSSAGDYKLKHTTIKQWKFNGTECLPSAPSCPPDLSVPRTVFHVAAGASRGRRSLHGPVPSWYPASPPCHTPKD